ncbi:hypothetical protein BKA67DRAFT_568485 [Truncatella angustata]|uniref:Uncharacterized protein n=1 Tax=Truncatella angustata TaxID=152316 RepID=A0A9P8UJ53_9PEZI|nr:uncharacterized protein BKA67DRAFT_568485 [Truncatella angustata]KAH6653069.1 hypothetical protein BKA67DRAFT_568485 [Truncatella angustata]
MDWYYGQGATTQMLAASVGNTRPLERFLGAYCKLELPLKGTRKVPVQGTDISDRMMSGSTALLLAAQNEYLGSLEHLLSRSARINTAT